MFIELGRAKAGSESGLVAATFMGFVSGKGGNDVMSGCSREWTKVLVVVAGREEKGEL